MIVVWLSLLPNHPPFRVYQFLARKHISLDVEASDEKEANEKFGFLLGAFKYGAPPHGGMAFGFDRICALFGGKESIRDFIAFPKNTSGRDVMIDSPSNIDSTQRKELGL